MLRRFDSTPPSSSTSCSYLLCIRRAEASFSLTSWNTELMFRGIWLNFSWQWIFGRLGEAISSIHILASLFGTWKALWRLSTSTPDLGKGGLFFIRILVSNVCWFHMGGILPLPRAVWGVLFRSGSAALRKMALLLTLSSLCYDKRK